jgi:hypothetical protein
MHKMKKLVEAKVIFSPAVGGRKNTMNWMNEITAIHN